MVTTGNQRKSGDTSGPRGFCSQAGARQAALGSKKVIEQFQAVTALVNTFVVNSDKALAASALARLKFVENSLKAISSTNEKIREGIKEVSAKLEEYRQ